MTKVRFYSLIREKLGTDSMDVKGNCVLEKIFEQVVKKAKAERSLFFNGNKLKEDYIILLNGKSVTLEKDVLVRDYDEVTILPILTGG